MRFICDINIIKMLCAKLRALGHACDYVRDIFQDPRTQDSVITRWAIDHNAIVISRDTDFPTDWLHRQQPPKLIRIGSNDSLQDRIQIEILRLLSEVAATDLAYDEYYFELTREHSWLRSVGQSKQS